MTKSIEAVFDGMALRPAEPLELSPNSPVRVTTESLTTPAKGESFLRTARALALTGPQDRSARVEAYLYGDNSSEHSVFLDAA
jgi:hypothetical protein